MIWIIGGTSETSELLDEIEGNDYVVTVATYAGYETAGKRNAVVRKMDLGEMKTFIAENSIDTVVDMSHPYAYEVSENGRLASESLGVRYIRYVRECAEEPYGKRFGSMEELLKEIDQIEGTVFFTTGIKNIDSFERIKGKSRHIYRVLPTTFSIERCVECGVKMENMVAMLGPFTSEFNKALFKSFGAEFVVMKDSGSRGGTEEKLKSCKELGIEALILGRRARESGVGSIGEILEMIK